MMKINAIAEELRNKEVQDDLEEKDNVDDILETSIDFLRDVHTPKISQINLEDLKPKINGLTKQYILEEGKRVLEFTNVNKDLGFGNLKEDEILRIKIIQNLIAFELRRGYWRTAAHDIQEANTLILISRSRNGFGFIHLFKRTIEKIFGEKPKEEKKGWLR